jgi:catechol 2,3-dioxygenase-like lactoylglutathione lyase family enzyme
MSIAQGAKVVAIILTRDVAKAKPFYTDVLGFPLIADDGFATVVDLNGIALRITEIPDHTPGPHTVIGWEVPDIAAAIAALNAKGVSMAIYEGFGQDAQGVWTSPDGKARVAWFFDPDGNNLSLTQRV